MMKKLSLYLGFILVFISAKAMALDVCGQWQLQGEGIYDGFIFNAEKKATILSIENFDSSYYLQGNMVHILHNRGGEFLLEFKQNGTVLQGQDFWSKGSVYKRINKKGC